MFNQALFPGNVILNIPKDGSSDKTEMRTIMTCSGCAVTMSTCDWDCGATFSYCSAGTLYGGGLTGLTCPGPTGLICDGTGSTSIACPTGVICGNAGNTLMTCSGGVFCNISSGNTSRTCNVFGCRSSSIGVVYPGSGNTFVTCSSGLYGLCGIQTVDIYGGSTISLYGGRTSFQAGSPPPF